MVRKPTRRASRLTARRRPSSALRKLCSKQPQPPATATRPSSAHAQRPPPKAQHFPPAAQLRSKTTRNAPMVPGTKRKALPATGAADGAGQQLHVADPPQSHPAAASGRKHRPMRYAEPGRRPRLQPRHGCPNKRRLGAPRGFPGLAQTLRRGDPARRSCSAGPRAGRCVCVCAAAAPCGGEAWVWAV